MRFPLVLTLCLLGLGLASAGWRDKLKGAVDKLKQWRRGPSNHTDMDGEEFGSKFHKLVVDEEQLKKNEEKIQESNANKNNSFKEGIYYWSDMSSEDFGKEFTGAIIPHEQNLEATNGTSSGRRFELTFGAILPPEEERHDVRSELYMQDLQRRVELNRGSLPKEFDARKLGHITKVKNQGGCGSCASFATGSIIETCISLAGGPTLDISEQYFVDCAYDGRYANGCEGATAEAYATYIARLREGTGACPGEGSYSYDARRGSCRAGVPPEDPRDSKGNPLRVNDAIVLYKEQDGLTNEQIKQMVYDHHAVITLVSAEHDDLIKGYTSGVINVDCKQTYPDHAVVIVGWGVNEATQREYWIIKNSWGEHYGDGGFFKIEFGLCHAGFAAVALECGPPKTLTAKNYCDISKTWGSSSINGKGLHLTYGSKESTVDCKESNCLVREQKGDYACKDVCDQDTLKCGEDKKDPSDAPAQPTDKAECDCRKYFSGGPYTGNFGFSCRNSAWGGKGCTVQCTGSICSVKDMKTKNACLDICGRSSCP